MSSSVSVVPTLIVFDLGGVIVRICRGFAEGCRAAGLPVRGEIMTEVLKQRRRDLSRLHGTGKLECAEFFREVSRSLDGLYSPEEIERVHHAWLLGEYPGVEALLGELRTAALVHGRFKTGVLSNTNHAHWDVIVRDYPSLRLIDHPHASHLMGHHKPDAEIYDAFAALVGYTGREREIVFFDDLEENVDAAISRGWQAVRIDHEGDTASQIRGALTRLGVLSNSR